MWETRSGWTEDDTGQFKCWRVNSSSKCDVHQELIINMMKTCISYFPLDSRFSFFVKKEWNQASPVKCISDKRDTKRNCPRRLRRFKVTNDKLKLTRFSHYWLQGFLYSTQNFPSSSLSSCVWRREEGVQWQQKQ